MKLWVPRVGIEPTPVPFLRRLPLPFGLSGLACLRQGAHVAGQDAATRLAQFTFVRADPNLLAAQLAPHDGVIRPGLGYGYVNFG